MDEIAMLKKYCKINGFGYKKSDAEYQEGKIKADGVCIVVYPHKTSAGNYHFRLRNEGSKNEPLAYWIMKELDALAGFNCTFQHKINPKSRYVRMETTKGFNEIQATIDFKRDIA